MKEITLKRPIVMANNIPGGQDQRWDKLSLRDIEAGDICDAGRELPESASRTEMVLRVASKCSGLPFVIIAKLKPIDIVQVQAWHDAQWEDADNTADADEDQSASPLKGETPTQS
ncbi:hypothetical protein HBA92_14330 [Ochrobactrum sp. MR28]|nr:hypothetical protein [Ochrobactrum sp. MR28]MBX8817449.1 hypothetical protein [Ochrobactrum sp. MR31]